MEIIYRAVDGKEFKDQLACQHYELHLQEDIIMLNRRGHVTEKTNEAFVLWLRDENANLAFHAIAESQGDDQVSSITKGEDYGLFVWDECREEYLWVDDEQLHCLMVAKEMIDERKDA